ncbi:helix-turn-helix domain-containing protein [Myxococcus sp. CA051A]|uniref:helix-turn-helix domain-containing protein n=1 Tax=Myxococcus sp. CA051A TaxID=2741739 RepID=UPI00157AF697|nr:helix-turn-helix domain-containing protein [Myxococcus sp. CA051A]NTX59570.1 helix-turn-helix domain-containing protein [Myxococcus sp. CA051A]
MMTESEIVQLVVRTVESEFQRREATPEREYLTQKAASRLADCSPSTIRAWCDAGHLTRHHNGRVLRAELVAFLAGGAAKQPGNNVVDAKAFAAKVLARRGAQR